MDQPKPNKLGEEDYRRAAAKELEIRTTLDLPRFRENHDVVDFHEDMVAFALLYGSEDLQDKRDAVAGALLAVTNYLQKRGFSGAILGPLIRPVEALVERENNALDQLFVERVRAGRPSTSLVDNQRTGILAAFAEAWLRLHNDDRRTQNQKLTELARKLRGKWFGRVTPLKLSKARETVSQEAKDHPAVQAAHSFYRQIVRAAETLGAENAIPALIRMLNDANLPSGMGMGGILKTPRVSLDD